MAYGQPAAGLILLPALGAAGRDAEDLRGLFEGDGRRFGGRWLCSAIYFRLEPVRSVVEIRQPPRPERPVLQRQIPAHQVVGRDERGWAIVHGASVKHITSAAPAWE